MPPQVPEGRQIWIYDDELFEIRELKYQDLQDLFDSLDGISVNITSLSAGQFGLPVPNTAEGHKGTATTVETLFTFTSAVNEVSILNNGNIDMNVRLNGGTAFVIPKNSWVEFSPFECATVHYSTDSGSTDISIVGTRRT